MNFSFCPSMDTPTNPIPTSDPISPYFHPPPNPNFSYFSQQAFRLGMRSVGPTAREFGYPASPMDIRGSIERELEKERIRAEIIAEEIIRRRVLEQEVRREMMMERELTFRRGGFRGGSEALMRGVPPPLLTNFEHPGRVSDRVSPLREVGFRGGYEPQPFQRDHVVAESGSGGLRLQEIKEVKGVVAPTTGANKEKVIILAKPSSNLADIKRKAMAPTASGAVEILKKQKTKEDWSCALCRVTATSERGFNEHLKGKKHQAREKGMVTQRTGFGTSPLPKMSNTNTGKANKVRSVTGSPSFGKDGETEGSSFVTVENAPAQKTLLEKNTAFSLKGPSVVKKKGTAKASGNAKPKRKYPYFCEMCQVGAYALQVFNTHMEGKRHLAELSEASQPDKAAAGETSTQEGVIQNKARLTVEETKGGTEGEQADTIEKRATSDVDRVENMNKVSETLVDEETTTSKSTDQVSVRNEVAECSSS